MPTVSTTGHAYGLIYWNLYFTTTKIVHSRIWLLRLSACVNFVPIVIVLHFSTKCLFRFKPRAILTCFQWCWNKAVAFSGCGKNPILFQPSVTFSHFLLYLQYRKFEKKLPKGTHHRLLPMRCVTDHVTSSLEEVMYLWRNVSEGVSDVTFSVAWTQKNRWRREPHSIWCFLAV